MVFAGSLTYHLKSAVNEVSLSDRLYRQAAHAGSANGVSQAAFASEPVEGTLGGGADSFDHLFTTEVLDATNKAGQQAKEGKCLTHDQKL